MGDPQDLDSASVEKRLSRTLGTIWNQHSGGQATGVETTIDGNVVRSRIAGAEDHTPAETAYANAAVEAVRHATGRKVRAFIPKYDSRTELTTQTYILEQPRVLN
jgi:hypothetical protein